MSKVSDSAQSSNSTLSKRLTWFMAASCGIAVANLYYLQPLLADVAKDFHAGESAVGAVAMLTQVGYALGVLFIVPMGDIRERKSLVLTMLAASIASMLVMASSPALFVMSAAAFAIGATSVTPQILLPFAAHLASPKERGHVIGIIMCGLLTGILLSRTFSGVIGQAFGWRVVYVSASALLLLTIIGLKYVLPKCPPENDINYMEMFSSLPKLVKKYPSLRAASINGAMMFGTFSVFWTSLIFLLASPVYHMGARTAGILGLIGVTGALSAPLVGRITDKTGPRATLTAAMGFSLLAYLCFALLGFHMAGLIAGIILLDLGTQVSQVSNQVKVHALGDEERSRLNTVFMFSYFVGGACGSILGAAAFERFGWYGVCVAGLLFQVAAWIFHFGPYRKS